MAQGEEVGREERGWAQGDRWRGRVKGEALCAGRERCLVGDGRGWKQEEGEVAVASSPSYK